MPAAELATAAPAHGIDHVTIGARDCAAAKAFYGRALKPLGFSVVFDWPAGPKACLALPGEASSVWIVEESEPGRTSLAFAAADGGAVDAFYAAGLAAGGRPLSPPAHRPEYTQRTYAAAVLDPDGNRLEAICRSAEPLERAA